MTVNKTKKYRKFEDYDDEVIRAFVEVESTNIKSALIKASEVLKRSYQDVNQRYYRKRAHWRALFVVTDNTDKIFFNTKNIDRFGKFKSDLYTTQKSINLKVFKVSKR